MNRSTAREAQLRVEYKEILVPGKTITNINSKIHMEIDYLEYSIEHDDLIIYFVKDVDDAYIRSCPGQLMKRNINKGLHDITG